MKPVEENKAEGEGILRQGSCQVSGSPQSQRVSSPLEQASRRTPWPEAGCLGSPWAGARQAGQIHAESQEPGISGS